MKTKLLILLLILFSGCSDKDNTMKYGNIRRYYEVMTPLINFVIQDQQSVLTDGLVTNVEVEPPTYRPATSEDISKAIEVSEYTDALKGFTVEIMENCKKLEEIYSKKKLFTSKDDKAMISLYTQFIGITEKSILELTGGKKAKDYIYPYVPKKMRNLDEFEALMSRFK